MNTSVMQRAEAASDGSGQLKQLWWLPLIAGVVWLLFGVVVFRFDYGSVAAVATLFGVIVLVAAGNELMLARLSTPGWRLVRAIVAGLLTVVAVFAFIDPGSTFVSLAAVMSFYFVVAGTLDVSLALAHRHDYTAWGLPLSAGIVELLIGFWAAGSWAAGAVTLLAFVGGLAVTRGVSAIALAFRMKDLPA